MNKLERLLRLVGQTKNPLFVTDAKSDEIFVLTTLENYERLNGGAQPKEAEWAKGHSIDSDLANLASEEKDDVSTHFAPPHEVKSEPHPQELPVFETMSKETDTLVPQKAPSAPARSAPNNFTDDAEIQFYLEPME